MNVLRAKIAPSLMSCLLLGCGSGEPTPEQALDAAAARLDDARGDYTDVREEVSGLRDELAVRREAVAEAEEALDDARAELLAAEKRLLEQEDRLAERATDVALFRSVQQRMLQEECLNDHAVSVEIKARVVTLEGLVASEAQKACAERAASREPGVARVRNRLVVDSPS